MRKRKLNVKRLIAVLSGFSFVVILIVIMAMNSSKLNIAKESPSPTVTATATPSVTATPEPESSESPAATPSAIPEETAQPDNNLAIRTDYENFLPNESGEIPIIMFHRFIEAYEEKTEKEYTTTFSEFEALLQTLYDSGYRLISMEDFIDCNIKVPAGTMPMVFTFDDGTSGQFNLIKEGGSLKVNPKSAVGIMASFNKKHPDFGLRGIFYVNMNLGDNTFEGEGTLKDRFEILQSLGFELGNHTWGHVDYYQDKFKSPENIQESLGKNQEKADEVLPGLRFYSLALPYGKKPTADNLQAFLQSGTYNGMDYRHDTIMAVGADPSVPPIHTKYNSLYVRRIRAQGRVAVDCDLTWWLPKMTATRMFISDGDPSTIVVPKEKADTIIDERLNGKAIITY